MTGVAVCVEDKETEEENTSKQKRSLCDRCKYPATHSESIKLSNLVVNQGVIHSGGVGDGGILHTSFKIFCIFCGRMQSPNDVIENIKETLHNNHTIKQKRISELMVTIEIIP